MTRSSPLSLRLSLRQISKWTASKLRRATLHGLAFSEDTITESLLLELAQRHPPPHFRINSWTKAEEGTGTAKTGSRPTGADWDFCFADLTGANVVVRVQAKRQYACGRYGGLDGTGQQIKDLWNNRGSALPIYVFYNNPGTNWPSTARRCVKSCLPRFRGASIWGCSYAPVSAIPDKNRPYPPEIAQMFPLHCLVCPSDGTAASLPVLVRRSIRAAYAALEATEDRRFHGAPKLMFELLSTLPSWAQRFIDADGSLDDEDRLERMEYALDGYLTETGLRGVALIQQLTPEARE